MIKNEANWDLSRFKAPKVWRFLIKMRILGGTSGKNTLKGPLGKCGGDHRSPLFHLSLIHSRGDH
jgi:hypothetical protein